VGHDRVAATRRDVGAGRGRQLRAHPRGAGVGRELGHQRLRRVALQARDAPAQAQPRLQRAQDDQRPHPHRGDQRAFDKPVLAQRVDGALFVARQLEVHVELDPLERAAREVGEALLERRRAVGVLVVVGEQQLAAVLEHVELDHVHAVRERGVERGGGVSRDDEVGALVSDPSQR
jgi:hypothetical protein